jgi:hypothetical protein
MVSDGFPQRPRFCFRVRRMKVGMSATSDEVLDAKATGEISYGLLWKWIQKIHWCSTSEVDVDFGDPWNILKHPETLKLKA